MKHYKEWNRRVKILFYTRLFLVLISAAGTIGLGVAIGLGEMPMEGINIAIIVGVGIFFLLTSLDIYRLIKKLDAYYAKMDNIQEAGKDPEYIEASNTLRNSVVNLDVETLGTIQAIARKDAVSKVVAAQVLVKTEDTVKVLEGFMAKYPELSALGVKEPKSLKLIYLKRIEALNKIINK